MSVCIDDKHKKRVSGLLVQQSTTIPKDQNTLFIILLLTLFVNTYRKTYHAIEHATTVTTVRSMTSCHRQPFASVRVDAHAAHGVSLQVSTVRSVVDSVEYKGRLL